MSINLNEDNYGGLAKHDNIIGRSVVRCYNCKRKQVVRRTLEFKCIHCGFLNSEEYRKKMFKATEVFCGTFKKQR